MTSRTRDRPEDEVSVDESFAAMSHPVRRRVIALIADRAPRSWSELETRCRVGGDRSPEQVRIELYHRHLPVLDDGGFVNWDREGDVVTRGPRFGDVRSLVEVVLAKQGALSGESA